MTGKPGRYLSHDESIRLNLLRGLDRQKVLAMITAHIRWVARCDGINGPAPINFYKHARL